MTAINKNQIIKRNKLYDKMELGRTIRTTGE
jgi:hypothetical protein